MPRRLPRKKKDKTILVVDEEESERVTMCRTLEAEGYSVLAARNYPDALKTRDQHSGSVDMLLTAIALPEHNGYELARTMIEADSALKVLFVSGPTGAEISRFYNMPVSGPHLIEKPFQAAQLAARVNNAFRSRIRRLRAKSAF
jgi:DNA-binding response OmpR family regulator